MEKKLVMVVEDDEMMAKQLINIIKDFFTYHRQYDVIWAKNGLEALELYRKNKVWFGFKQNRIKCILLDLRMPEMDGVQFVTQLRKIEEKNIFAQFIPVLFITAWEDKEKWESAIDSFVSGYIKKPVEPESLKNLLWKILYNKDAEILTEKTKKQALKKYQEFNQKGKPKQVAEN